MEFKLRLCGVQDMLHNSWISDIVRIRSGWEDRWAWTGREVGSVVNPGFRVDWKTLRGVNPEGTRTGFCCRSSLEDL